MEMLDSLKFCIRSLKFRPRHDKIGVRFYFYCVIKITVVWNVALFLVDRWDDLDDRILAFKAITLLVFFFVYAITFVTFWDEFAPVIDMFERIAFPFPFAMSPLRVSIISSLEHVMNTARTTWKTIIVSYVTSLNILPLLILVTRVLVFSEGFQNVITNNLSTPFPLYYPRLIKTSDKGWINVIVYVVGYFLHTFVMVMSSTYGFFAHVTTLSAMANIEYELKLLKLSLLEMEGVVRPASIHKYKDNGNMNNALQRFVKYFLQHHQETCRKFRVVNRGIRWIAAMLGTTASIYMCLSVYTVVQKDQIVVQIEETLFFSLWAFSMYLFGVNGEKVRTEDENLRNALYECSWMDKPRWFKSSLLLAMTRCSRPIDIKPFGLFALNLNAFAKTMNAVYSYYNILNTFKKS